MNILVINGSPKGKYSITLQTMNYLMQKYPDHKFEVLDAGQKTRSLERDFTPAADMIDKADLLIFSYPVYTFIAPYQLHRFIELLKDSGMNLSGKFATQFSTSKNFSSLTSRHLPIQVLKYCVLPITQSHITKIYYHIVRCHTRRLLHTMII